MTAHQRDQTVYHMQEAIEELKELVLKSYPSATFSVCQAPDEPAGSIDILTFVDIEDTDEVLDVVMDRLLEIHNEYGFPLHIIPTRPEA